MFGTTTTGTRPSRPGNARSARTAAAPFPTASDAKSWPSTRAPGRATNRSPGRTARESTAAPVNGTSAGSRDPERPRDVGQREVHVRDASSAAMARSSNGSSRSPMIWVVSCPLPAMTTTVPGLARSIAARIAWRRSAMRRYFVAPEAARPRSTSERMASGSSERGLSEVAIGMSARVPGDAAHRLALAAVAVPAAAEDEDDLPVGQLAHGREQPLERVRRVRVVDEDRVGLPRLHPLEPARHGADGGRGPPRPRRPRCPGRGRRPRPRAGCRR